MKPLLWINAAKRDLMDMPQPVISDLDMLFIKLNEERILTLLSL